MSQQPVSGYQPVLESGPLQWLGERLDTFEKADTNPFNTWGDDKPIWAKGGDFFLNLATNAAKVPWAIMTGYGKAIETGVDRPVSTFFQAVNLNSPLYDDGFDLDDIKRMWGASESDIGAGRAFANLTGSTAAVIGRAWGISAAEKDGYANYLSGGVGLDPDFNPYALTEEQRRQLNNNAVYNFGTGFADAGYDVLTGVIGDKGVSAFRRSAGLRRNVRNGADLRSLEDAIAIHQDVENPQVTNIGRQVDTIAQTRDLEIIRAQAVTAGIRNPGILYQLQKTSDPVVVGKILRASRGDVKAISDLTTAAPDTAWVMTSADRRMSEALGNGYRIAEDPDGQLMIESATDAMFKADPGAEAMRELFWQKHRTGEKAGEFKTPEGLGYAPKVETLRIPAGVSTTGGRLSRIGEAAAGVQTDVRGAVALTRGASRTDLPDTSVWATRLIGVPGVTPVVRLLSLAGEKLPSQVISLSPNKPEDPADELIAQSREMTAWRARGKGTVTFESAVDGSKVSMNRYERETDIRDRILTAHVEGGEQSVLRVIRQIEEENLSVLFHQRGRGLHLTQDDFDRIVSGVVASNGKGHGRVHTDDLVLSRDGEMSVGTDTGVKAPQRGGGGYYVDGNGQQVEIDPQTLRGLANSYVTLPMRQIEDTLVAHTAGLSGRAKSAVIIGRQARDTVYGVARATMLMRLGYIPKNSMADPAFARLLALGEVAGPDGLTTITRFGRNMALRGERVIDAVSRIRPSRRISVNERRLADLRLQRADYEDQITVLQDQISALNRSVDPLSGQLREELLEQIGLVRQSYGTLLSQMDLIDPRHRLEPVAFDTLDDITGDVKQWVDDIAMAPDQHIDDVLTGFDDLYRSIRDHSDATIAGEDGSLTIVAEAWRQIADGRTPAWPLEDLVPTTLTMADEVKSARLAQRADVTARLESIGVPPMPLIQRMTQDFERYAPQYGILPGNWDTMNFDDKSAFLRDWLRANGARTPWGRDYPGHNIDSSMRNSEVESALNSAGTYAPAGVLADSSQVQPGMRLYRAMSQAEWDSTLRGHVVDGEPLALDTSLPIVNGSGSFWSVEGLGREGQQQGYWWTGQSPETGGGFGSFYDNPEAPIVVEVVVTDPAQQVIGRDEVTNLKRNVFTPSSYDSNIGGDWEKRLRPGAYVQVLRAWKAETPTGRTSLYDDERIPIDMTEGATPDPHWTEVDLPAEAHTIIDIERGGSYTASHRVGGSGQFRRVNGGSWQRELEQIDRDLMDIDRLESAIEGYVSGSGEKVSYLMDPTVAFDASVGQGVARLGSSSVFTSTGGDA
jgi:hypothetical protein